MMQKAAEITPLRDRLKIWVRATRMRFFTAVILPIVLGAAIFWQRQSKFSVTNFFLSLIIGILLHSGTNQANDFWDTFNGTDRINKFYSPFNGGSRVLVENLLKPSSLHTVAIFNFLLAISLSVYLSFLTGWVVLILTVAATFFGYFYSAPPIIFSHRAVGELVIGTFFGPLATLGGYYAQGSEFSWAPIVASVPIGLLIFAVIYINEFPDIEADGQVGKNNLVVRMGRDTAIRFVPVLLYGPYVWVVAMVFLNQMPITCLIVLIPGILFALKANIFAKSFYNEPGKMIPASAMTIMTHMMTGIFLIIGYFTAPFIQVLLF
ncbi:MAG: 1,4-dihydroxy-2-naphthoate octaprenyltransferase [Candidatus Heimdallarchaeota archaeon]